MAALVVILGLAFFIALQDQHAADQDAQKAAELHKAASSAIPNEQHPQENVPNPAVNSPRLYGIFRWPNGTTTWTIILTLLAIAEQTYHTRRAADISAKMFVSTFRPRIIVRYVHLEYKRPEGATDKEWMIELLVVNIGGAIAHLDHWSLKFDWVDEIGTASLGGEKIEIDAVTLEAGENRVIALSFPNQLKHSINLFKTEQSFRDGRKQVAFPECSGTIAYADENGCRRNTGFLRTWDVDRSDFIPSKLPEVEYQD